MTRRCSLILPLYGIGTVVESETKNDCLFTDSSSACYPSNPSFPKSTKGLDIPSSIARFDQFKGLEEKSLLVIVN
jgi:hypothetical protein